MQATEKDYLSPPQVAQLWRVNVAKIYELIARGSLIALNMAVDPNGRPRLRIKLAEIARFEASRSTKPPPAKPARRRRKDPNITEYF